MGERATIGQLVRVIDVDLAGVKYEIWIQDWFDTPLTKI